MADAAIRYDGQHKALRAHWAKVLARGEFVPCARCGAVILAAWPPPPGTCAPARHVVDCTGRGVKGKPCDGSCWSRWELGHRDGGGPRDWSGPEHFHCNRKVGGINGGLKAAQVKAQRRRDHQVDMSKRPHISRKP